MQSVRGFARIFGGAGLFLGAWVLLALAASPASADILVLADGRSVEGKVVKESATELVVEITEQGKTRRETIARAAVVKHLRQGALGQGGALGGAAAPANAGPVLAGKVLFLIDRSGSMAIGRRHAAALTRLRELIEGLGDKDRCLIQLFDEDTARPLIGWTRTDKSGRAKVLAMLAKVTLDPDETTDLAAAVEGAARQRPDRVVLITDGVVTRPGKSPLATVDRIRAALAKAGGKAGPVPLHAEAVLDGDWPVTGVEDKTSARALLKQLAGLSKDGSFHEVSAAALPNPPAAPARVARPRARLLRGGVVKEVAAGAGALLRIDVADEALAQGALRNEEYPAPVRITLESFDAGGQAIGKPLTLATRRRGARILGARAVEVVAAAGRAKAKGALVVRAGVGGLIRIVYERDGESFATTIAVLDKRDEPKGKPRGRRVSDLLDGKARLRPLKPGEKRGAEATTGVGSDTSKSD